MGGVEWGGGRKGQVWWVPRPLPPCPHPPFSELLPMTSRHWEETGSLRFECLPKKKAWGLSSLTMVGQKGEKK